ncbi:MAG TPA: SAM-dependent methyltransferase [Syntrophobacteraceae bacterium]|nr:SAM-dependent methyltransferase [Syntrophobacteraceae bacterium]
MHDYVHGYSDREAERLHDQADAVMELIHHDTHYPAGSRVLEAGCGVGAQTVTLAARSPDATFLAVDHAQDSLQRAQSLAADHGLANVQFAHADLYQLPYDEASFDHVFLCFVLEHLTSPIKVLAQLRRVLRPGGTITVVEGDHGSCYFFPETKEALRAWQCLIDVQASLGANSLVGRQLYPLLRVASFQPATVSPRMLYMDSSNPKLMDAFVRKTIVPMVEGVREPVLAQAFIDQSGWAKGIRDLRSIADDPLGTFCYTFFKAVARR